MQIERTRAEDMVVDRLPDGSTILTDRSRDTVFALNPTAGAAWDACGTARTVTEIAERMKRSLKTDVSQELAEAAIAELEEKNLVMTSGAPASASRRRFITQVGLAAVPLVVALTMDEQKAYAFRARSGKEPQSPRKPSGPGDFHRPNFAPKANNIHLDPQKIKKVVL